MKTIIQDTTYNEILATYDYHLKLKKKTRISYNNITYTIQSTVLNVEENTIYIYVY